MDRKLKRYRQISIFEYFERSKKSKSDNFNMDENSSITKLPSADAEKKVPSPENLCVSENNVCQAADDSCKMNIGNCDTGPGTSVETGDQKGNTDDDDDFKASADLFPEQASFEEGSSYSEELFPNSESNLFDSYSASQELFKSTPESDELDFTSVLNRSPDCRIPLPRLEPLENHTILFSPHIRPGDAPRPYPSKFRDYWDSDHVRMPCSSENRYPVEDANGETRIQSRWNLICRSLKSDIGSSRELEEAIMKYNTQYRERWNFQGLHAFINNHWSEEERVHFFDIILPFMVEMALNLPNICTQPVPLLTKNKDHYVTMSQKQIGCLLLNAFFCTFPRRTSKHGRLRNNWAYATYPDINFNRLFAGVNGDILPRNAEKLKCLFNYFRRIACKEPTGTVTFHRQYIRSYDLPKWSTSTRGIRTAVIKSQGLIECEGQGMLQVDFANRFVGGGVLGHGCVQEEIRFIICPELIVSRLFVESLETNEVLIVTGVEQYNKYSGCGDSFKWEGDFRDDTPRDSWGRRYTQLVAMDAFHFKNSADQFKVQFIKRELTKAYCGFYEDGLPVHLPAVATGNWGCGAFKGNVNLKFLIQLMAASEAGRCLLYFTFGNKKLKEELQNMYNFLNDKNLSVGDVWRLLMTYIENVSVNNRTVDLYGFIYSQFVIRKNSRQQDDGISDSSRLATERLFDEVARDFSSID